MLNRLSSVLNEWWVDGRGKGGGGECGAGGKAGGACCQRQHLKGGRR